MSAAAAPPADAGAAAPAAKKGKKKLVILIAAALVVLGGGGGGAAYIVMKKKAAAAAAAAAEEGGEAAAEPAATHHADPSHPPTFVPLDPFVVNLADRDADKYAQIGITLQVDDAKFADQMKAYMPAIRNGILMVLAHKTSTELLQREGKEALAAEVQREAVRPMGIEIEDPAAADAEEAAGEGETKSAKKAKKKKHKAEVHNPVEKVHFSNFIIQ